ncbi:Survival protein SurA precursor (Peptidyl-prolyl cis-trans isomerase SurA) [Thioalkalivibrio nitratireducens DSM 14787]|uniref:Chaperone SurA n=1 Tax=Thioalkalivibrio nitratireducens (strain DSM 14787 / UNIQEM 213 / ALEN2) TaxID=1255043 RepID=L0DXV8_THIND|nr:peptidylprolyl isomerase [Thioalkalivibrio nitratireducens]AGA33863.1 Survival protein SurA precursor (Peptidyl-prolyl cis-trans isomerase SurA) [Thioalkalivibrio nitratireducens DSM 14787]
MGHSRTTSALAAIVLIVLSTALHPALAQERDRFMDRIVAVVGEDVVTQRELVQRLQMAEQQLVQRGVGIPDRDALVRQVMERMVLERIQLQEAERVGIRIDELALNRTMENIAAENNLTLLQLRNALQAEGVDFNQFREQIRDELTIAQLRRRQVEDRLRVGEQEIDDLIAAESGAIDRDVRYHLAHILVALPQGADSGTIARAREQAGELRDRAVAGEDFAGLAITHSDAPDALEGGDLGWRGAADIPTLFARNVILMRPGEITPVLRSPNGFHIVKLIDREGGASVAVDQARVRHILISPDQIRGDLEAEEQARVLYRRIQDGASFADLARAHSDDPGSAARGGELGWISSGETVPAFEEAVAHLAVGEVSAPVQSPFGWHIIEVLDRRAVDASRELLRARAREILQNRKREEETELWLRRLRDEAFIEYRIEGLRS